MTKHRSFIPEFKAQVVLEVLTGVRSASEVCQHYQLKPEMLSRWKTQFLERAATVFEREEQNNPALARVAELERLVGRLTDVSWRWQKSLQSLGGASEQRREVMQQLAESYVVQVICRVWQKTRSTYYYRSQASDEHELRVALHRLAGMWPRYGSRRLTAQLQWEGF